MIRSSDNHIEKPTFRYSSSVFADQAELQCEIGSKICGVQIVRAPATAAVDLGSGGTDQVTIGIKRVQKARFIVAGIWLKSLQRAFVYEKRRLDSAVVSPKSHGTPRAIIRTTVIWKLNHG